MRLFLLALLAICTISLPHAARAAYLIYGFSGSGTGSSGTPVNMTGFLTFNLADVQNNGTNEFVAIPGSGFTASALGDVLNASGTFAGSSLGINVQFAPGYLDNRFLLPPPDRYNEYVPGWQVDSANIRSATFSSSGSPGVLGGSGIIDKITVRFFPQDSFSGQFYVENSPAVPEPGTWAMLIGGFAMIGALLRRPAPAALASG